MRPIILLLGALFLFPTVALGKSLYVRSNTNEALVRTGPGVTNRILVILKPGQEVTLVKEEGDHYVITTSRGVRGYVLKYQMTDQNPAENRLLQELEQKLQQRITELEKRTQEQEQELTSLREERGRLEDAKKAAEVTASRQAELASRLQAQQSTVRSTETRLWFLTGAGVLLAGFLLGWMWGATSRRYRRSSLSINRL